MSFRPEIAINENLTIKFISGWGTANQFNPHPTDQEIRESNGVIFEYFPPEFVEGGVMKSLGYGRLYIPLLERVRKLNKTSYAFDPAHTDLLCYITRSGFAAGLLGTALGGISVVEKFKNHKSTRREILGHGLFAAASLVFSGQVYGSLSEEGIWPNESTIRRLLIAKSIIDLSKQLTVPQRLLLVYPDVHIEKIQGFLSDRIKLDEGFSALANFRSIPHFEDKFFQARVYQPIEGSNLQVTDPNAFSRSTFGI